MAEMLQFEFMQRALLAALLVGVVAPMVGIFIVQRGLSMIGDALGHVALAGVGIGLVMHTQPVWSALVVAVAAALLIETLRARGGTGSDVVIALMLHAGIALGVVLLSTSPAAGGAGLENYLYWITNRCMSPSGVVPLPGADRDPKPCRTHARPRRQRCTPPCRRGARRLLRPPRSGGRHALHRPGRGPPGCAARPSRCPRTARSSRSSPATST